MWGVALAVVAVRRLPTLHEVLPSLRGLRMRCVPPHRNNRKGRPQPFPRPLSLRGGERLKNLINKINHSLLTLTVQPCILVHK